MNYAGDLNFTSHPNLQTTGHEDHGKYEVLISPPYKHSPAVRIIPDIQDQKPIIQSLPDKVVVSFVNPGEGKAAKSGFLLIVTSNDE